MPPTPTPNAAVAVLVKWSKDGKGVEVQTSKTTTVRYSIAQFCQDPNIFSPNMRVHILYKEGMALIGYVADLWTRGVIKKVYIESGTGQSTLLDAVTLQTITVSRYATVESLRAHDVYVDLAPFVPRHNPGSFASVIGIIFDPRWYVDPDCPNRTARLEAAFSLNPRFDAVPRTKRSFLEGCWRGKDGNCTADADFYGRMHHTLLSLGVAEGKARRKVARHFLRALSGSWMDAYRLQHYKGGDRMFDPKALFDATALAAVRGRSGDNR